MTGQRADCDDPAQDPAWLRRALDAVLAGESPDPAETDPVRVQRQVAPVAFALSWAAQTG